LRGLRAVPSSAVAWLYSWCGGAWRLSRTVGVKPQKRYAKCATACIDQTTVLQWCGKSSVKLNRKCCCVPFAFGFIRDSTLEYKRSAKSASLVISASYSACLPLTTTTYLQNPHDFYYSRGHCKMWIFDYLSNRKRAVSLLRRWRLRYTWSIYNYFLYLFHYKSEWLYTSRWSIIVNKTDIILRSKIKRPNLSKFVVWTHRKISNLFNVGRHPRHWANDWQVREARCPLETAVIALSSSIQ